MMAKIVTEPEDDLPRLIYADWLEEQGDPRCQLIRLQCEIAQRIRRRQEWRELRHALDELRANYQESWLAPLKSLASHRFGFDRGLLGLFSCAAVDFVEADCQRVLVEQFPRLGCARLWLSGNVSRIDELADSEALSWSPGFFWKDCQLSDAQMEVLAASPRLFRLSLLELTNLRCTNRGLLALANSSALPRLKRLGLKNTFVNTGLDARGVAELVRRLPSLKWLHLEALAEFRLAEFLEAAGSELQRLESLTLAHPCTEPFGELAGCPHLTNLTRLELFNTQVKPESLRRLIDNPALARLRTFTFVHSLYEHPLEPGLMRRLRQRFPLGYPAAPAD